MSSAAPVAGAPIVFCDPQIEMAHGAGGKASRRLVEGLLVPAFGGALLDRLDDAAVLEVNGARLALTTDAFVVRPLRFPGGSIGDLAVNGTVNDLAVTGAAPLAMLVTLVIEAGLTGDVLAEEIQALAGAARRAGVPIVGGDTKVVEHGKADGLYITTTGVGSIDPRVRCSPQAVRPGDRILLSGRIGDHGIAVLLARADIDLDAGALCSDTRSVWPMVRSLIEAAAPSLRWMRDPTRGGVATVLTELARDSNLGVALFEDTIPVRDEVRGACELLGLDVLHIANEGQFLAVVAAEAAGAALDAVRSVAGGEFATIIGEIREGPPGTVIAANAYGGSRLVDMLVGDPLPRIC
jgi:hydrogenase expression/formation protein HypE